MPVARRSSAAGSQSGSPCTHRSLRSHGAAAEAATVPGLSGRQGRAGAGAGAGPGRPPTVTVTVTVTVTSRGTGTVGKPHPGRDANNGARNAHPKPLRDCEPPPPDRAQRLPKTLIRFRILPPYLVAKRCDLHNNVLFPSRLISC